MKLLFGLAVIMLAATAVGLPARAASVDAGQLERFKVTDVVIKERETRDAGKWGEMATTYFPDTRIDVWFKGSGAEFIESSKKAYEAGNRQVHILGPVTVVLNGDRALAEYNTLIRAHQVIDGVPAVSETSVRVYQRLEKRQGEWGILKFNVVYQLSDLRPALPGDQLKMDRAKLAAYPGSYRFVAYALEASGVKGPLDLIGVEQPDRVAALTSSNETWLASGK